MRLALFLAATALCVLFPLGCGSPGAHLPKTVPAAGVVTLDGQPVDGAQVIFVPTNQSITTGAFGTTNASGHFSVRAYDEKDGAIPGEYKVRVSKTKEVKLTGKLDGGDAVRFEHAVPAKYTDDKMSGLTVTVPETGIKDITLALKSK